MLEGGKKDRQRIGLARERVAAYNHDHKQPGQHHGPITYSYGCVLVSLLRHFQRTKSGAKGVLPASDWLAADAECSRETVRLALKALRTAGLIEWARSIRL